MPNEYTPSPAIAALGAGRFKVIDPNSIPGASGASKPPEASTPGIFGVPTDSSPESIAIRAHEYGHLTLDSTKLDKDILSKLLTATEQNNLLSQAILDVLVNRHMINQGVNEVKNLPFPDTTNDRAIDATTYLRGIGVRPENESVDIPALSPKTRARLQKTYRDLSAMLDSPKIESEALTDIARKLHSFLNRKERQSKNGPADSDSHKEHNGPGKSASSAPNAAPADSTAKHAAPSPARPPAAPKLERKPIPESIKNEMQGKKSAFLAEAAKHLPTNRPESPKVPAETFRSNEPGKWAKMLIATYKLEMPIRSTIKRGRAIKPGFNGAMRYPVRALLPAFDGSAFGDKRRSKGGTLLIDLSGSMGLSDEAIVSIITKYPLATITGYAGAGRIGGNSYSVGALAVIAKRGKRVRDIREMRYDLGGGNMIDGPALEWLAKQPSPRSWICDGKVTGVNDDSFYGAIDAALRLKNAGRITRYYNIENFLNQQPSGDRSTL